MKKKQKPNRPTVDIVHPSHQPSVAELREDQRIDATFDQAVDALTRQMTVNYVKSPKNTR